MSTGIKPLEQSYLTAIFDRLGGLVVHLDSDPLVYGPKRLNLKTALVRKMLTECEQLFLQVSKDQANYKRQHRAAKVVLDVQLKHLLANEPTVRAGRAVSEREAIAYGMLKAEAQEVSDAENAIEELDAVMQVIKAKRADLRDIQGRLRDQVRLCQEEIGLGSRWGSKNPRGVELQPGQGFADGGDVAAIEAVIQKVRDVSDAERHLRAEVDTSDTSEEELDALVIGLGDDDGDDEDKGPAPARATPQDSDGARIDPNPTVWVPPPATPEVITGAALVAKFGFAPHCSVCGEPQSETPSGMTCPRGHGGAESVPPPSEDILNEGAEASSTVALSATADPEEVASFLSLAEPESAPRKSRFQVEEEDGMDLDSILASFNG